MYPPLFDGTYFYKIKKKTEKKETAKKYYVFVTYYLVVFSTCKPVHLWIKKYVFVLSIHIETKDQGICTAFSA